MISRTDTPDSQEVKSTEISVKIMRNPEEIMIATEAVGELFLLFIFIFMKSGFKTGKANWKSLEVDHVAKGCQRHEKGNSSRELSSSKMRKKTGR